jgi:uracil DNA glycosylase
LGVQSKCWLQWALFSARFVLMSLSQCLMNGSADCVNVLIEEGNMYTLTNFHPSILFAREMFLGPTDFLHLYSPTKKRKSQISFVLIV